MISAVIRLISTIRDVSTATQHMMLSLKLFEVVRPHLKLYLKDVETISVLHYLVQRFYSFFNNGKLLFIESPYYYFWRHGS